MKEVKIDACPFCGGKEIIECSLNSYGGVYAANGWHSSTVYANVCRDCGSIVRSYCKEPEKLLPKKERRN